MCLEQDFIGPEPVEYSIHCRTWLVGRKIFALSGDNEGILLSYYMGGMYTQTLGDYGVRIFAAPRRQEIRQHITYGRFHFTSVVRQRMGLHCDALNTVRRLIIAQYTVEVPVIFRPDQIQNLDGNSFAVTGLTIPPPRITEDIVAKFGAHFHCEGSMETFIEHYQDFYSNLKKDYYPVEGGR